MLFFSDIIYINRFLKGLVLLSTGERIKKSANLVMVLGAFLSLFMAIATYVVNYAMLKYGVMSSGWMFSYSATVGFSFGAFMYAVFAFLFSISVTYIIYLLVLGMGTLVSNNEALNDKLVSACDKINRLENNCCGDCCSNFEKKSCSCEDPDSLQYFDLSAE